MKLFDQPLRSGTFRHASGQTEIEYRVYTVASGYKIAGTIRGLAGRIELLRLPAPDRVLVNNWQSWGPTLWLNRTDRLPGLEFIFEKGNSQLFSMTPETLSRHTVSDYFLGSDNLFLGFLSSRFAHPYFTIEGDEIVGYLEYFGVSFDHPVALEPLIIFQGKSAGDALSAYGGLIGEEHPRRAPSANPVGWCSWYHYFNNVQWADVAKNLRLARGRYPYQVFQIDDGYQQDVGDWTTRRDGWPDLSGMAAEIRDHGFAPGIWTAPFLVAETSRLYRDHPDWIVDHSRGPRPAFSGWGKATYGLDTTHPDARQWLRELFSTLREAGFRYFKIDFLYAGAMPGERYRSVSPLQAYREGLRTIREAVGNDFILGCGAPLLPSVGYVDGMRVGEDTAPTWNSSLSPFHGPNAYHALKNPLMRQFMHRNLWLNDPDCLLLRREQTQLSPSERQLYALVAGALDAMIIQSDNLALVDEEGFTLLKRSLALRGGTVSVRNPDHNDLFLIKTEGGPSGTVRLAANLSDGSRDIGGRNVGPRSVVDLDR